MGTALSILGLVEAWEVRWNAVVRSRPRASKLHRALGGTYLLINAVRAQAHLELLAGELDAAAAFLVESLRLTVELGSHEVSFGMLLAAEVLRRRGDVTGAAHAHRIAGRAWPHDEGLFQVARRYIARDTSGLDSLPASHWPMPPTLRQQVGWAIERLGPSATPAEAGQPH